MKNTIWISLLLGATLSCSPTPPAPEGGEANALTLKDYFSPSGEGVQSGGVKMIPISTPAGEYRVWTKRFGNNPRINVLLLHGGPGATHEYFESVESFSSGRDRVYLLRPTGQRQLRSSGRKRRRAVGPPRFVEEVEQVRLALGLNSDNFFLLGSSWGGILAMEYALKYQQNLKGLIITNMMASAPDYDRYADEVLAKQMDPAVLKEVRALEAKGEYQNPRYMELLMANFYTEHICRFPLEDWPEPVNRSFSKINQELYVTMQGPSEFGLSGKLENWDVKARLPEIRVPTLTIGATHDTMDPKHMEWISTQVQNGQFLLCPNGSHLSMWDDQQTWMDGVIGFLLAVDGE
ncbi:MAG: proline iminopeptidase-family hydrolase [Haliscomenobacter sp.]|nr:proline iminopeptidase-family hydrolase [Haliscomenobacter sp.]